MHTSRRVAAFRTVLIQTADHYRPAIDGLRALAVLPVIFFHGGVPGFGRGYVGVDVFFVISGYLITSLIATELKSGRFDLAAFYERRARRILPALFFVVLCTLPLAWVLLLPDDLERFAKSVVAVPLFLSNVYFWRSTGYFDTAAEWQPLLHTWSLAVEEQYYLAFPLLMLAAKSARGRTVMLATLCAASLALAAWGTTSKPAAAFYLFPTRAWELLAGGLLAIAPRRAEFALHRKAVDDLLALAGLVLVVSGLASFPPGLALHGPPALLPVAGSMLLIACAVPGTWTARFLSWRPLVGLGLISYSAYLWHQPIFAFTRHGASSSDLGPVRTLAGIALTLVLAAATWAFVERPFRARGRIQRKRFVRLSLGMGAAIVSVGLAAAWVDGFAARLSKEEQQLAKYARYDFAELYLQSSCFLQPEHTFADFAPGCGNASAHNGKSTWLIWGDSHAAAIAAGARHVHGPISQYTASLCPPVLLTEFAARVNCPGINAHVLRRIAIEQPARVYLHANWTAYDGPVLERLGDTILKVKALSPQSIVVVIGSAPKWGPSLPQRAIRAGAFLDGPRSLRVPTHAALVSRDDRLANASAAVGARFVSPIRTACKSDQCPAVVLYRDGYELVAWDDVHFTEAGAVFYARLVFGE